MYKERVIENRNIHVKGRKDEEKKRDGKVIRIYIYIYIFEERGRGGVVGKEGGQQSLFLIFYILSPPPETSHMPSSDKAMERTMSS